jgi:hypothetical protein
VVAATILIVARGSGGTTIFTVRSCFLRGRKQEGTKEQCGVENDWEVCGSTTRGKRHQVDGTAGAGLTISGYIKDTGNAIVRRPPGVVNLLSVTRATVPANNGLAILSFAPQTGFVGRFESFQSNFGPTQE